jgi:hypothetical protein
MLKAPVWPWKMPSRTVPLATTATSTHGSLRSRMASWFTISRSASATRFKMLDSLLVCRSPTSKPVVPRLWKNRLPRVPPEQDLGLVLGPLEVEGRLEEGGEVHRAARQIQGAVGRAAHGAADVVEVGAGHRDGGAVALLGEVGPRRCRRRARRWRGRRPRSPAGGSDGNPGCRCSPAARSRTAPPPAAPGRRRAGCRTAHPGTPGRPPAGRGRTARGPSITRFRSMSRKNRSTPEVFTPAVHRGQAARVAVQLPGQGRVGPPEPDLAHVAPVVAGLHDVGADAAAGVGHHQGGRDDAVAVAAHDEVDARDVGLGQGHVHAPGEQDLLRAQGVLQPHAHGLEGGHLTLVDAGVGHRHPPGPRPGPGPPPPRRPRPPPGPGSSWPRRSRWGPGRTCRRWRWGRWPGARRTEPAQSPSLVQLEASSTARENITGLLKGATRAASKPTRPTKPTSPPRSAAPQVRRIGWFGP